VIGLSALFRVDLPKRAYNSVYSCDVSFGGARLEVSRNNIACFVCLDQFKC
jgi:hypothetical protein